MGHAQADLDLVTSNLAAIKGKLSSIDHVLMREGLPDPDPRRGQMRELTAEVDALTASVSAFEARVAALSSQ